MYNMYILNIKLLISIDSVLLDIRNITKPYGQLIVIIIYVYRVGLARAGGHGFLLWT